MSTLSSPAHRSLAYVWLLALLAAAAASVPGQAAALSVAGGAGITAEIDADSGHYEIRGGPGWIFSGTLESAPADLAIADGADRAGPYRELSFRWQGKVACRGSIRLYTGRPAVLLSVTTLAPAAGEAVAFPRFAHMPAALHGFSYGDVEFAPPSFTLEENGTPWLLFDAAGHAAVISPASHFLIARLRREGQSGMATALGPGVASLPAEFTVSTLLVLGAGINSTWNAWGATLVDLMGVRRPGNDADVGLRYLGYWTDNGAAYYYNYDARLGYAGTLRAVIERYRREGIPVRYLQLDSWWYSKTLNDPLGNPGQPRNPRLPHQEWNRYGGLTRYEAHPALFPQGLAAFQQQIGLPLITHGRWIDPASPYHQSYRISGLAPIDPRWWQDVMTYLAGAQVVTYEQDWLNVIYQRSPELQLLPGTAEAFSDGMAAAARAHGLTLQYSMTLPRQLLQGARYDNLTTARVSLDRLRQRHWDAFLYTSRLASALEIWPWSDVFMSGETGNLLLATLSGGMVGIGDQLGAENRAALLRAVRADGVIVKPDTALVPIDSMYLQDAAQAQRPMVAAAITDHGEGMRTAYVLGYRRSWRHRSAAFTPREVGVPRAACVYDTGTGALRRLAPDQTYSFTLLLRSTAYFIVAPESSGGLCLLGDSDKFVSSGRRRISALREDGGALTVRVSFAPQESSVQITGYAPRPPHVAAASGAVSMVAYDPASGRFELSVRPDPQPLEEGAGHDPVTQASIAVSPGP
jgi:hypothetical protein